jgi:hypothetical protein
MSLNINSAVYVRPEQVSSFPNLSEEKKVEYTNTLTKVWAEYESSRKTGDSVQNKTAMMSVHRISHDLIQENLQALSTQHSLNQQGQPQPGYYLQQHGQSNHVEDIENGHSPENDQAPTYDKALQLLKACVNRNSVETGSDYRTGIFHDSYS